MADQQQIRAAKHWAGKACKVTGPEPHLGCCRPRIWRCLGPSGVARDPLAISHHNGDLIEQDQPCRFFPATLLVTAAAEGKASYELPGRHPGVGMRLRLAGIDDIQLRAARNELENLRACFGA